MYKLLENLEKVRANEVGFKCDKEKWTYAQMGETVRKIGEQLIKYGVEKGDKVGIVTENPMEFVKMFFAVSYCKAIMIPIYLKTGYDKITSVLEHFEIKYVLSNEDSLDSTVGKTYIKQNIEGSSKYKIYINTDAIKDEQIGEVKLILFSSGTTNLPKAVMLTEENIISNIVAINKYLNLNRNDIILLIKNMNHASSIIGEFLLGIYVGACLVFTCKLPKINTILKIIELNKVTMFFAIPFILENLLQYKNSRKFNIDSLKQINFYGGKFQHNKILELIAKYPKVNFIYSYGLTEASPRVTYITGKELGEKYGSCGKAIQGVKVTVRDDLNNMLPAYKEGEVVVEGPNIMKGYYKNESMTASVIKNGMLYTRDLGYLDEEGYLYITGRKDNMFIIAGKNVHPEEIENIINTHKCVRDSLVIKSEKETIIALIEMREEDTKSLEELNILCESHLEYYKVPTEFVIVPCFERTISGKIVRNRFDNGIQTNKKEARYEGN